MTSSTGLLDAGQPSVPELARQINERVQAAEDRARGALQSALEAGLLLNQAKLQIPHGKWNDWLLAHCVVAPRTARSYMRLATTYPTLSAPERQRVADLPVREAVKAIATDPTPAPARGSAINTILNSDERSGVEKKFQEAAKSVREASKWFGQGRRMPGAKADSLRKKLTDALTELDRLQGGAHDL